MLDDICERGNHNLMGGDSGGSERSQIKRVDEDFFEDGKIWLLSHDPSRSGLLVVARLVTTGAEDWSGNERCQKCG